MILEFLLYVVMVESCKILTTSGPIKGRSVEGNGENYCAYQGIPYAEAPNGSLRFKPPVPKTPWSDLLDATKEGPVCPQPEKQYKREQMSEDCLRLNIYVPANKTRILPILVFVHGGEFKYLSGNEDPIYNPGLLLQRNVIFVTMNFRLGALGFLSLDTKEATGNAGIKDILLALTWIKANANRFGGNSSKITIGGNSSGAVLVHYLLLSTKATGLFQQAMLISGSALGFRFLTRHPKAIALALAEELGFESSDINKLLQHLKNTEPFDIIQAQEKIGVNDPRNVIRPIAPFAPCIEIENESAVITKDPREIIKSGIPQNVPILAGFNAQEGINMLPTVKSEESLVDELNKNFELCIPSNIEYPYGSKRSIELSMAIRSFYFGGADISNRTLQNYVDFVGDTEYIFSIDSWIKLHTQRNASNALYYYLFTFDGDLNWSKLTYNIDYPGTSHSDDLGYTFITKVTKEKLDTIDCRNRRMVKTFIRVLTNFINYGNPTPTALCPYTISWPKSGKERNHLVLGDHPKSRCGAPTSRLDFWYNVYDQYYNYLYHGGPLEKKIIP